MQNESKSVVKPKEKLFFAPLLHFNMFKFENDEVFIAWVKFS